MGEHTWVLDSCVSSCRYISYDGLLLLAAVGVVGTVWTGLVVLLVTVVIMLLIASHARIIARMV